MMKAETYIKRYRDTTHRLLETQSAMEQQISRLSSLTQTFDEAPVMGTRDADHLAEILTDLEEVRDDILAKLDEQAAAWQDFLELIDFIEDDRQRTVLTAVYLDDRRLCDVAQDLGISYRQALRVHEAALSSLEVQMAAHGYMSQMSHENC